MAAKIRSWLERARRFPVIGGLADDLLTMSQLIRDHARGSYHGVPKGTLLAVGAALLYALSPIDLILDIIPFAGLIDDAAVISLILELGLSKDLDRYRSWKRKLREQLRREAVDELLQALGSDLLALALLTEQKQLKLLCCRQGDNCRPLRCRAILVPIDTQALRELGLDSWDGIGEFYTSVFTDAAFPWSPLGRRPFMPEYGCDPYGKDFTVEADDTRQ